MRKQTRCGYVVLLGTLVGLVVTQQCYTLSCPGGRCCPPIFLLHHAVSLSLSFWDRPYNENDRVNRRSQLEPKSGKSYAYLEEQAELQKSIKAE